MNFQPIPSQDISHNYIQKQSSSKNNMKYSVAFILVLCLLWLTTPQNTTDYKVIKKNITSTTIELQLEYTGKQDYYIKEKSVIIKNLTLQLKCLTYQDFDLKIFDRNNKRYEVPQGGSFPKDPFADFSYPLSLAGFIVEYTQRPFSIQIKRKGDNAILFSTASIPMIFSDYYIQIGTQTSSQYLYGLSERFTNGFRLRPGKWTIFPRDRGQMMDNGIGNQTHGYYPIYLEKESGNNFHMSYFRSSNALDVIIQQKTVGAQKRYLVTYKVIGGIIDFRFFIGESKPQEIILSFQKYMGQSAIPPFWSLGMHQCRWGYKNVTVLETVLKKYEQNNIPLDTIWSDIDYMNQYETFTIDEKRFPLKKMEQIMKNYHYVPIIEPSIRYQQGYAWEEGKKRDVFIKDAQGNDQIGKVWAGEVVFTDYFHPNATQYWFDMLEHLYQKIPFSGAWIDMNQISNLCNGPCSPPEKTGMDYTNDIPYHPGSDKIQTQAIPLNATHYGNNLQANVHTFFGFMETVATNKFLMTKGRPFIITRSNTLGTNKYGFHWTGDNYANFDFLRTSISSNFMFNFWGIQMVGSDICGFGGNATEENCARWFQLGSLYPFARNHNQDIANDQQPYALGPRVLKSSQLNLKFRYSILKHYYTQFIVKKGYGFIFKPLFFEFYADQNTYNDEIAETQFMIGSQLMSTPIVEEGQTSRSVYFPTGSSQNASSKWNWYSLHSGEAYESGSAANITNQIDSLVPIFIRDGSSIFVQNTTNVLKSSELKSNFIIEGAFQYLADESHGSVDHYYSEGTILSINDYENEEMISKCINNDCVYKFRMDLSVVKQSNQKQLRIKVYHTGDLTTIHPIQIIGYKLFIKSQVIEGTLPQALTINGTSEHLIPLNKKNLTSE